MSIGRDGVGIAEKNEIKWEEIREERFGQGMREFAISNIQDHDGVVDGAR